MPENIEKARFPTTEAIISCDTFDQKLNVKLHSTEDQEIKVLLDIGGNQLSIYQEDLAALIAYLIFFNRFARPRMNRSPLQFPTPGSNY